MTRKLATIQRIKQLVPISGADRIEIAIINGWQVVVKKGDHKEGELIVYLEIDSFVPTAVAPFLTKEGYPPSVYEGVQGERLKTIKLRKQLSQGLVLPLASVKPYLTAELDEFEEGDDLTPALGVLKWEKAEKPVQGRNPGSSIAKRFPAFIPKTDQERIQNYGAMVERALDEEFEVTMKKDGSSMTVFRVMPSSPYYEDAKGMYAVRKTLWQRIVDKVVGVFNKPVNKPVYGICSRNVLLNLEGDSNFHVAAQDLLTLLRYEAEYGEGKDSLALQGEVVAPDIQGNYEKVSEVEFHLFDVFNIDEQKYKGAVVRQEGAERLGIKHATVVAQGKLRDILGMKEGDDVVKKVLDFASGPGDNPGVMREGLVFKALNRDFSFKGISNEYLLHKED
jgi:RNA ligase (TIGR02306 family)